MPESHSEKGLKTLELMGTKPEDWCFTDIEWREEVRDVPTEVTCPECWGQGRRRYMPDGSLPPEPPKEMTYGMRERWYKEQGAAEGRCKQCPPRRNWPSHGTGIIRQMQPRKVMIGKVLWPKGTRFDSRFGIDSDTWNRPGAKFVCELCSKTINRSSIVPVHSLTQPPHGMWVGQDCARKFFDIKVLKRKDHFLEEHLEK